MKKYIVVKVSAKRWAIGILDQGVASFSSAEYNLYKIKYENSYDAWEVVDEWETTEKEIAEKGYLGK